MHPQVPFLAPAVMHPPNTLQVTPLLAERFFGSALELTSHDNYCPFWASDAQDPHSRPSGSEDGESVVQVSQRVHQLFQVGGLCHGKHAHRQLRPPLFTQQAPCSGCCRGGDAKLCLAFI